MKELSTMSDCHQSLMLIENIEVTETTRQSEKDPNHIAIFQIVLLQIIMYVMIHIFTREHETKMIFIWGK